MSFFENAGLASQSFGNSELEQGAQLLSSLFAGNGATGPMMQAGFDPLLIIFLVGGCLVGLIGAALANGSKLWRD